MCKADAVCRQAREQVVGAKRKLHEGHWSPLRCVPGGCPPKSVLRSGEMGLVVALPRSPLHHAFYWGHLCAAARLLAAGASLHVADTKVHLHHPIVIQPAPCGVHVSSLLGASGAESAGLRDVRAPASPWPQGRTPLGLLSAEMRSHLQDRTCPEVRHLRQSRRYSPGFD